MRSAFLKRIFEIDFFPANCIFTGQHNASANSHRLKRNGIFFTAIVFTVVIVMSAMACAEGRPLKRIAEYQLNLPSSSKAMENRTSLEQNSIPSSYEERLDSLNASAEIDELRYNIQQMNSPSTSKSQNASTSTESVIFLPHNQTNSLQNVDEQTSTIFDSANNSFLEESRRTFLRLNSGTLVKAPLLPDEERQHIWLQRHRQRKLMGRKSIMQERREHSLNENRFISLNSAKFTNAVNHTCKGDLFKHKVRMAGCEPKIIINRFCHGSCASFYIPRLRAKELKASFRSCAACVPSETDIIQIKLDCPGRAERELYRNVMRVKRCACKNIEIGDYDESDDG